jgi:hypothetical protein
MEPTTTAALILSCISIIVGGWTTYKHINCKSECCGNTSDVKLDTSLEKNKI